MDEGIWLDAKDVERYFERHHITLGWFCNTFSFEEYPSKIRIYRVRKPHPLAVAMLSHFGYGMDLRPLPPAVPADKRLRLETVQFDCGACGRSPSVRFNGVVNVCYNCLSEGAVFAEMEVEKRDS